MNNNNNKESNGSGSANNTSHRPKSGSSSVSPFNHSSSTKSSGGGGKSSPVLISPTTSPAFKPYEICKPSKDSSHEKSSEKSVSKSAKNNSSSSLSRSSANSSPKVKTPNPRSTPPENKEICVVDSKKTSSSGGSGSGGGNSSASNADQSKSTSSSSDRDHGASPIIRSGLEVLQQGQFGSSSAAAEYNKRLSALSSLSALGAAAGYPPGFDPINPAFRPPFFGSPHSHHAAMGYPFPGQSPYVSYNRVKTASGAETIVPVCKDPYCTGCQYGGGGVPHGHSSSAASGASSMNGLMARQYISEYNFYKEATI